MSKIQILIKEANQGSFRNWVMTIYNPEEGKESKEFCFLAVINDISKEKPSFMMIRSCDMLVAFKEEIEPFLNQLCISNNVQIIIGQYMYSKSKDMLEKLVIFVKRMKRYLASDLQIELYGREEESERVVTVIKV